MLKTAYNSFLLAKEDGSWIGWAAASIGVLLLESETTIPDNPTHQFVVDIVADESSAAAYARILPVSGFAVSVDALNRIEITHTALDFGAINASILALLGLVYFYGGTTDADRSLIQAVPLPNLSPDGTGFILSPGSDGITWSQVG